MWRKFLAVMEKCSTFTSQNHISITRLYMKNIITLFAATALLAGCASTSQTDGRNQDVAPYACFAEGKIAEVTPKGWLKEFLERQATGMTGHPEALSYPYNTCLWAGTLDRNTDSYGSDWWRYEQTAYYTDGLLRLGYLIDDEELVEKGRAGIEYTLSNASEEGELGQKGFWGRWPFAVFFRAMQAEYEATGDRRIVDALERHYMYIIESGEHIGSFREGQRQPWRNILTIEGMLWTYSKTGNKALLDYAVAEWDAEEATELNLEEIMSDRIPHMHGVTYNEELKLPMMLYAYTGERKYLDAALRANDKLVVNHMLPDGVPSSNEHHDGRDPITSHETCNVTDYTWTLGHFLMTTGEGRWADAIEKAVFNAGPGAVTKDFKALQYFSSANQFIATSTSDNNPFKKGSTWMAYRPTHETECCAGNVHRFMPNYVSRMWLCGERDNEIVAAMYGPSEAVYELSDGRKVTIAEETAYPFEGEINFVFDMERPALIPFTFRVPEWCAVAVLMINGKVLEFDAGDDGFYTVERRFRDGDVLTLELSMPVEIHDWTDSYGDEPERHVGSYVQRGPLLYSYAIPADSLEDTEVHENMHGKVPENPDFRCWNMTPAGPWNYALKLTDEDTLEAVRTSSDGYPFDLQGTPYRIPVQVVPVKDWNLDEGRYTPHVPSEFETVDDILEIELVPYGCTTLRLTVFPTE